MRLDLTSSDSPYTPPKSSVRALVRMLDDEAGRLAFIRRLAWSLSAVGFGLMVSSVLFSTASDSTVGQPVLAIIGGYLVGVSSFCFTSLRQWPVLRRCLDVDRIRADHEKPAS